MNFGISDNSCMFVTFYAKGTKTNEKNGHFYVLLTTLIYKIRLFKSHVSRFFSKLTVPLARMRGEQPFLYSNNSNFVDTMPKENNNLKPGDNSTLTSTQPSEKGKSQLQKLLQSALKKADEKEAENKRLKNRYKQLETELYRTKFFNARNCHFSFSIFDKNNPVDKCDWKKLYEAEMKLREAEG